MKNGSRHFARSNRISEKCLALPFPFLSSSFPCSLARKLGPIWTKRELAATACQENIHICGLGVDGRQSFSFVCGDQGFERLVIQVYGIFLPSTLSFDFSCFCFRAVRGRKEAMGSKGPYIRTEKMEWEHACKAAEG